MSSKHAAGEDVRWLPRSRARVLLPALDGWVMDEETVILHLLQRRGSVDRPAHGSPPRPGVGRSVHQGVRGSVGAREH
ncbi:DUF6879 family protein [Streptomyces sp. NPDC051784]|uniref:DUF6879 family protein n=1 Tax=Streptomyces sp. NPDC051784 TaxID=3155805 RepID=UPI00341C6CDC